MAGLQFQSNELLAPKSAHQSRCIGQVAEPTELSAPQECSELKCLSHLRTLLPRPERPLEDQQEENQDPEQHETKRIAENDDKITEGIGLSTSLLIGKAADLQAALAESRRQVTQGKDKYLNSPICSDCCECRII